MILEREHSGTSAVHVLVLGEITPDGADREWRIEHPQACPVACWWWPDPTEDEWVSLSGGRCARDGGYDPGTPRCPVEWEVDGNGIDGLCDEHGREWRTTGAWTSLSGSVVPRRPGLDVTLPPGRYLVESWWHDGYGMGEYGGQGDGDGLFTLLGPETPPGIQYPPDMLLPYRAFSVRPR